MPWPTKREDGKSRRQSAGPMDSGQGQKGTPSSTSKAGYSSYSPSRGCSELQEQDDRSLNNMLGIYRSRPKASLLSPTGRKTIPIPKRNEAGTVRRSVLLSGGNLVLRRMEPHNLRRPCRRRLYENRRLRCAVAGINISLRARFPYLRTSSHQSDRFRFGPWPLNVKYRLSLDEDWICIKNGVNARARAILSKQNLVAVIERNGGFVLPYARFGDGKRRCTGD